MAFARSFAERSQCFVTQYEQYDVEGIPCLHLDGSFVTTRDGIPGFGMGVDGAHGVYGVDGIKHRDGPQSSGPDKQKYRDAAVNY
jgi:hypothetical protein